MVTGGVRLRRMIMDGKICRPYLWIDAYNQLTRTNEAGTITTRIDAGACWFISTPPTTLTINIKQTITL